MPASRVRSVGGAPYNFPTNFYPKDRRMTAEKTPQPELVHGLQNTRPLYPLRPLRRHMVQTKLAVREAEEKAKVAARRRRDRKEFAWNLLLRLINGTGALAIIAIAALVGLYVFAAPAAAEEKYYRYTCGTYACPQGFRVINPGRTIPPGAAIVNMPHQHWSSITAPGYGMGTSAPSERAPRPVGNLKSHGGGGSVIYIRPQWPRH